MQAAPDAPHDGCSDEGVPIIALLLSQEDPSQDVWADLERLGVRRVWRTVQGGISLGICTSISRGESGRASASSE